MDDTTSEQIWVLDWQRLSDEDALERVQWLRDNLAVGTDWNVCNEPRMCVLKTESAGVMYRMRWFDGSQSKLDSTDIKIALESYVGVPANGED
jgi:hypothetical protein